MESSRDFVFIIFCIYEPCRVTQDSSGINEGLVRDPRSKEYTLPETNCLHLKMDGWNTFSFPLGAFRPIFRGELAVSFREGNGPPGGEGCILDLGLDPRLPRYTFYGFFSFPSDVLHTHLVGGFFPPI